MSDVSWKERALDAERRLALACEHAAAERQAVRRAALEEAARVAEAMIVPAHQGGGRSIDGRNYACALVAASIRELADKPKVRDLDWHLEPEDLAE